MNVSPVRPLPPKASGDISRHSVIKGTELLRLPLGLLQIVVQEIAEQVKTVPLPQEARGEISQITRALNSLAADGCLASASAARPKTPLSFGSLQETGTYSEHFFVNYGMASAALHAREVMQESTELTTHFESVVPSEAKQEPMTSLCTEITNFNSLIPTEAKQEPRASKRPKRKEDLLKVFHELDTDGGGTLTKEELRTALHAVGFPSARAQKILNGADVDGSGEIDFSEWKSAVEDGFDEDMSRLSEYVEELTTTGQKLYAQQEQEIDRAPVCIIRPDSPMRLAWDMFLALLCAYVAVVLPFTNGFEEFISTRLLDKLVRFELAIDILFLLDVCLNFRTGIAHKNGTMILGWRRIAYKYLSSWFLLDLLSSIPLSEISSGRVGSVRILKLLKIPKMLRAFRVLQPLIMSRSELGIVMEESLSSPFSRAVFRRGGIVVFSVFLCHWLSCLMAFCSLAWIMNYLDRWQVEESLWHVYLVAAYWAMTTMSTVGWGDIVPSTDVERAYTIFAMVVGGLYYGMAMGTIVSVVSNRDLNAGAFHDRMDAVYAWLDHHKLSQDMRRRIIRYFKAYLTEKAAVHEADVVNQLSPSLRKEVGNYVVHEDIRNNPLFDNLPINAVTRLQNILHKVQVEKDHKVVENGEVGTAMFIVNAGMVRLERFAEDGCAIPPRVLSGGDSFGEEILAGLEERYAYTATVIKRTASLFMIEEADFLQLFEHMPDVKEQVIKNATMLHAFAKRSLATPATPTSIIV